MVENNGEKNEWKYFQPNLKTKEDEQVSSYVIRVTNLNPQTTDKQCKFYTS